jgi:nucleoside 2-deoxyribosyltransferase
MIITIIGSTHFQSKMWDHEHAMRHLGHSVYLPVFDNFDGDELALCSRNRELIEAADEVHVFWDQRSTGTIFDFGMAFALRKPVKIIYMEEKTLRGVMEAYERTSNES